MKKSFVYALSVFVLMHTFTFLIALDIDDNPFLPKKTTGSGKIPKKTDPDEKKTKDEFVPGIWDSIKKGLSDEELEKVEEQEYQEGLDFEDPIQKTLEEKIEEMQEKALKQDFIARSARSSKELALDWARKDVNAYLNNTCASSLVRVRNSLSDQERQFRTNRYPKVNKALQSFLKEDIDEETLRNAGIAFVATGGGYRAMILTTGYLAGLERIGLLDGILYTAGLSGSTWMIGPWITQGGSIQNFKAQLQTKITSNKFNIMKIGPALLSSSASIKAIVDNVIWPKFLWKQPIRSIDFYGYLLGQVLLGNDGYKQHLSNQWEKVRYGNYPFPLYTAISMSKKGNSYSYDWYEFNPVEVRVNFRQDSEDREDRYLSVPICAFGSEFDKGKTVSVGNVTVAPEQMFGYWLGTFGSAFAINSKDIDDVIMKAMSKDVVSLLSLEGIKYLVSSAVVSVIKEVEGIGKARISPAQIYNPFKNFSDAPEWLQNKKYLTLVDAAISYNIPAKPLLWPARKIKFIIIGESSSSVENAVELKKFFEDAKDTYGYNYSRIDDGKNKTIRLYKDKENADAPRIIYLTYLKDPKIMALTGPQGVEQFTQQEKADHKALQEFIKLHRLELFNPLKCVSTRGNFDFCNTFNFNYSIDDFKQLVGMAEFNVRVNKEVIAEFIRDELHNEADIDFPVWGNP